MINVTIQNSTGHSNASIGLRSQWAPGAPDSTFFVARVIVDPDEMPGAVYLQAFENNGSPVDDDVPFASVPVVEGYAELNFGPLGRLVPGAFGLALSSTPTKYTPAGKVGGGDLKGIFDGQSN